MRWREKSKKKSQGISMIPCNIKGHACSDSREFSVSIACMASWPQKQILETCTYKRKSFKFERSTQTINSSKAQQENML